MEEKEVVQEEVLEVIENLENKETQEIKKVKEKKKKVDKEKEELKLVNLELKEKLLRVTAEMQNMRRRYEADIQNIYKYDGFDLAEKLLPIIDNFERAMNVKIDGADKFLDGFKMIYENLISVLKEKGIFQKNNLKSGNYGKQKTISKADQWFTQEIRSPKKRGLFK